MDEILCYKCGGPICNEPKYIEHIRNWRKNVKTTVKNTVKCAAKLKQSIEKTMKKKSNNIKKNIIYVQKARKKQLANKLRLIMQQIFINIDLN